MSEAKSSVAPRWDAEAIVVGSGFGGAVAAARLAQAGLSVIVLERGRRWGLGEFPREHRWDAGWLWDRDRGLYDIRWLRRMGSIQGAGWGGGSLVYANVFARPAGPTLDDRWPPHLKRDALDPYYDLAAHMLSVAPTPDNPRTGRIPPRTLTVESMVANTDIAEATVRPQLAVTFGDPDKWIPHRHGVPRRGCAFVGDCVLGCNHGAKNSLDVTYLAVAERAGARAVTDAQVTGLAPHDDGYAVTTRTPSDANASARTWTAPRVVLATGALATTELLLRARDVDRTLPRLSERLGHQFSGNGDFLTLAHLRDTNADMTEGPTITTTTVLDVPEGRSSAWFQVQDGAIPLALHGLIDASLPAVSVRRWWRGLRKSDPRRSMALLAMGHDSGSGRLRLDRAGGLTLAWQNRWQSSLYRAQSRVGPLIARLLGAKVHNPVTWSVLRRTITVHALGGVPAGLTARDGVVDQAGEVHGYPGLIVMDGSVLPASTGVNPSATILAAAERAVETLIRRSIQPGWRAPEWAEVEPVDIPEDAAFAYMAQRRTSTAGNGVAFSERMVSRTAAPPLTLELTARVGSMDRFMSDPAHNIAVHGNVTLAGVANGADAAGTLSLFPSDGGVAMRYDMTFDGADGRRWRLLGTKRARSRRPWTALSGLTQLHVEARPVDDPGALPWQGEARIGARDLRHLLLSLRGEGFTVLRRMGAAARFAGFFCAAAVRHAWGR